MIDNILVQFFTKLETIKSRLLMLDYDGTLAPFRPERDQAYPYPGIRERLIKLIESKSTRTVIVTGRAIKDIKPLLGLKILPEIWGSHGWEHLGEDGHYEIMERGDKQVKGLEKAAKIVHDNNYTEHFESKPASVAIHFRGLNENKVLAMKDKICDYWLELEKSHGLEFSTFDGGLELKIPGFDKGHAVRNLLQESPSGTIAAYLGDDLTDEDAFTSLPDSALGVLVRKEYRETAAQVWLKPPEELFNFLDRWINIDGSQ